MKKSLTIIMVIGVIGIILMMMLMQSFMSRMTGSDLLPQVRADLAARHSMVLEDPDSLKVTHRQSAEREDRKRWLVIEFSPKPQLSKSLTSLQRRMRMMARQVFSDPALEKRYDHIDVQAHTADRIVEVRVTREEALTRIGRIEPMEPSRR